MGRERKIDIYKIDNYLLFFGKIFLLVAVIAFIAIFFPDEESKKKAEASGTKAGPTSPGDYGGFAFFFAGGTAMIVAGSRIRKKERKTLVLLKSLELTHELSVREFLDATGFSREDAETAFRTINSLGLGYYLWNRDTDTIVDGRLKRRMLLVDTCPACGKAVGQKYSLDLDEIPACPACGTPFSGERWNNWKTEALRRLDKGEDERGGSQKGKNFSVPVFVILLIVFWPAAMVYFFFRYFKAKETRPNEV